ncbi:Metallo-dependent phosphatase-like protein [Xylogone sp. PMI_703]|nr:Metallo-dependent phosphatase-like protein [Xylogone sp. PMI_703]
MGLLPSTRGSNLYFNVFLGLIIVTVWFYSASIFSLKDKRPYLRLDRDASFKIAIFSDLHYGEEEHDWGITQDISSTKVMAAILDYETPDLVVFDGDLITGENTFRENSSNYINVITKSLVDRGVPWASTYGNHDSKFNLSREAIFAAESRFSLSYTQHSPPNLPGVSNYYLLIYPASPLPNDEHVPVAVLWFFDSRGGAKYQQQPADVDSIPNWVDPAVASWFRDEQIKLQKRYGGELPSLAFVHIPVSAFLDLQDSNDMVSEHFPGLNADFPLAFQGDNGEDREFMQALVDTPKLHSVYSGHDHGDSWCGNWPNSAQVTPGVSKPHLCFCKHTGYGGYGTWNRGSRIIELTFNGKMDVQTWVRMENGDIITHVHLNSTYGSDVYPTTDGE